MDQDNNLSVRDAVKRLEKSFTEDTSAGEQSSFSIPGYLRPTTSAKNKLNPRLDSFSVISREVKKPRMSTQHRIQIQEKTRPRSRQGSRESSLFSISSTTSVAPPETMKSEQDLILIAKCVQYQFLYNETERHFENMKRTAEDELSMAEAAVSLKRKQDELTLKEMIKNDPTDIFHHLIRASELVKRIQKKIDKKDTDFTIEKELIRELLLEELVDLKIPASPEDFDINLFVECRELLQSLLDL